MDVPKLLGSYVTLTQAKTGIGATQRHVDQNLKWFAAVTPDNRILIQPMGDDMTLSGLVKPTSREEFFINFYPESADFDKYILPDMKALIAWLGPKGAPPPTGAPAGRSARLFSGLLAIIRGQPTSKIKPEDYDIARAMLAAGQEMNLLLSFQQQITTAAIDERKHGNYDHALRYYERSMEVGGKDDHLLFNLARVHYEMGNVDMARKTLYEAMAINPDLAPAKKFLDFLDSKS